MIQNEIPSLRNSVARLWHALTQDIDTYRPERHYMRGPGPKWHAKYDGVPALTTGLTKPKHLPTAGWQEKPREARQIALRKPTQ